MPSRAVVVVVGGANMDVKARAAAPLVPATSNPGATRLTPGGVGRNVAENLARLGTTVHLIAAVGNDALGAGLLEATARSGVDISRVRALSLPTGTYTAILDHDGELQTAVSDMAVTDALEPSLVESAEALFAAARFAVLDANLPGAVLDAVLDICAQARVPVLADPVSVPKALRLPLTPERPVHTLSPDASELAVLTGMAVDDPDAVVRAARTLHARGVRRVWVRLGAAGSMLVDPDDAITLAPVPGEVVDVSGGGDAMLAAYCHALLRGDAPLEAATFGQAAGSLTVAVPQTVRPDLSVAFIEQALAAREPGGTS